jgi:hypothetical protein
MAPDRLALWLWLKADYGPADARTRFQNVEEIRARLRLDDEQSRTLFRVLADVKRASVNARIRSQHRDRRQALHDALRQLSKYARWRRSLATDLRLDGDDRLSHRINRTIELMKADQLIQVLPDEHREGGRRAGRPRKQWIGAARRELTKALIGRRDQDDFFEQVGATDRYAPRKTRRR